MAPLAPDFEKLATAFFNGDSIPEDLDDIPARSKTSQLEAGITGKNHITNYDTSDWKCLLEQNIHREPIMVRFLMDVIMCNKMEKVCSSKNLTYHNASVHRDSSYIMVMDQLKVAETRQSRLNESTTDGSIWEVTLIYGPEVDIDNPPDPSEGAEEGAVVIDTFKPQSEPAPGKIKKKKNSRRKGKYNSGKAAGNDPVHVSEAEGDLQMSDRVSVKDVPLSDQGDDTSTGMSPQRQSEDAAQSMSSKENFAMTPPVIKVQDLSADTLQHTDDDNDWNIVRAKASQRAKGAPRGSTGRLQGRARLTSHQVRISDLSVFTITNIFFRLPRPRSHSNMRMCL
jgi:hypothetical protein